MSKKLEFRNLIEGEKLPPELSGDFPQGWEFDREWTWVALFDSEVIGVLLGAPCHGIVLMMMVKVKTGHGYCLIGLIRYFIRESVRRGFKCYMTHLNREKPEQMKLLHILELAQGNVLPFNIVCVGGNLQDAAKY